MVRLFNVFILLSLILLMKMPILFGIYKPAVVIPGIAVGVRRIHDTGRSGWWILFPISNLVFFCLNSEPGDNDYGPNPQEA